MSRNDHLIEPEELMAYLDGELSPDRAVTAAAHLERCRECQAVAADLQSVSRQMTAWELEPSERRTMEGLNAALEQRKLERSERTAWRRATAQWMGRWTFGLAGAGVCVVTLFMVWTLELQPRAQLKRTLQADQRSSFLVAPPKPQAADSLAPLPASKGRLPRASTRPMIVRTAQLSLTTADFDRVRDRVSEVLKRHQGYIGELNIGSPAGAARTLEATLRVPTDQLEAATAELKSLGRVESESQSGEEVTEQYVDLEARLTNARNTELRLTDLLRQRTGKLSDVLAVEKSIDEVRGSIERMEAEKKNLGNRVDFATLTLRVTEDYKAQMQVLPASLLTRFQNAAVDGYRGMVDGVAAVLLTLLSYGPSLLLWAALLFFPVRAAWRRLRRPVL
jgi:hypothetical protein